ncbi:MAG TPA: MmgE/PrpD family protein [Pseudonocardiaceae bacterium]|nr:MmgE/PrpD family protein [Pseudonocardiaceae bacterium]
MAPSTTSQFAEFLASVRFEDLPNEVGHEALRILFDTMLCAIAAQGAHGTTIVTSTLSAQDGGTGSATILGQNRTASPSAAAFMNATAANALDLDDNLLYHCHIANTVIAAALAAAEETDASGTDLLTAVAVGYEAAARVTLAMPGVQYIEDGELKEWHDPWGYSYNTIGGAVAAGKLYGVDATAMRHLLGLAAYGSPVPSGTRASSLGRHPMSKYGAYGWQASAAVFAAALAANGYTADEHVFDGPFNYWRMLGAHSFEPTTLTRELGSHWWLPMTSYKIVPAGTWMRPALWALRPLLAEPGFEPDQVEGIDIHTRPLRKGGEGANVFASGRPTSYNDTQVSYRYLVAVTVLGISPNRWQHPDVFGSAEVNSLIDRTAIIADPEVDKLIIHDLLEFPHRPKGALTRVRVRLAGGRTFENESAFGDGDPFSAETHITDEKLQQKFMMFAAPYLSDPDKIADRLWSLADAPIRAVAAELRSSSVDG